MDCLIRAFHTKWIVIVSIFLTVVALIGFSFVGTGMGPIYPSIQHMAPGKFGRRYSAAVIGLQMASAYVGSTFMPMIFGQIQLRTGIWIMPFYLLLFAALNIGMLEYSYKKSPPNGRLPCGFSA